jgi:hypothetical protein
LTPGQCQPDQYIDYTTSQGLKLWNAAIAVLPFEFDVDSGGVNQFCEKLADRTEESGWQENGNIIDIPDSGGVPRNLIREYGLLTLQDI